MESPVPEQVTIRLLPPFLHHSVPPGGNDHAHGINKDLATSVCNALTPVGTLQELFDTSWKFPQGGGSDGAWRLIEGIIYSSKDISIINAGRSIVTSITDEWRMLGGARHSA